MTVIRSPIRPVIFSPVRAPTTLYKGGGAAGFAAETEALVARFTTPPTDERKAVIDTLIKALKTSGAWSKLDALWVMAAADAQAARRNWIADAYNLTAFNSPTFLADHGYTGNGSSSYLGTGINLSTLGGKYALNDNSAGVWVLTNQVQSVKCDIGANGGTSDLQIRVRDTGDVIFVRANNIAGTETRAVATGAGLTAISRTASDATKIYRDGSQQGAVSTAASVGLPNGDLSILARSAGNFSANQASGAFLGASLSDAEQAAVYAALNSYLTAVGAI